MSYPPDYPRELLEGEIGSLNYWITGLLDAIKHVRDTFRDLDNSLFETDEGDIRQRELSKYEKEALTRLYAAMNEPESQHKDA